MNSDHIIKQFEPLWGVWSVEKKLGEGTYGSVYQVSRKDWDRSYEAAVKVISIPSSSNEVKEAYSNGADDNSISTYFEDAMKNMIKEIEFMYKFKGNSHIVSYEDHWIHTKYNEPGWHIFIRMELLKPLNEYYRGKQVTELDITKMGIQICHALESCYQNGVIHRDIKDANIFVTKDGNFKLGDFGIARELSRTSKAGTMKGTPNYMAPEVYKSLEYNHTADIYSLGMVLYKMSNHNRYPFAPDYPSPLTSVDNDNALLTRLEGKKVKKPLMVSVTLGDIILKALEFNPMDRYITPKEFRLALENYEKILEINKEPVIVIKGETEILGDEDKKGTGTVFINKDEEEKIRKEKERLKKEEEERLKKEEEERLKKEQEELRKEEERLKKEQAARDKKKRLFRIVFIAAVFVLIVGGAFTVMNLLGQGEKRDNTDDIILSENENEASSDVEKNEPSSEAAPELTWSINQPQIILSDGETFKIEMIPSSEVKAEDYKWTWSSRDESIARIDAEGNITAVGNGKTFVSASLEGTNKVYNAQIEVKGMVAQTSTEAPTEPPTQAVTQKTTQPTTQPTTQKTTQPTTEKTTQPTTQPTTQATTQTTSITFGDATFESLVRKAAGKPTGTLTADDLSKIYTLDVNSSGITSISGIQYIKNLKQLNLSYNSLTDISKLSGLTKLTYLNLKGNSITSINALKNLTNLKKLYLSGNPISDYSPTNGYFSQLEDQDFK